MGSSEDSQDQLGCGLVRACMVRGIQEVGVLGKGISFHLPCLSSSQHFQASGLKKDQRWEMELLCKEKIC